MIKYVYNKEINVMNTEPFVLDLYPESDDVLWDVSWYAIYYKGELGTEEWHVKATSINEALGAFFVENEYVMYSEIIDHVELA